MFRTLKYIALAIAAMSFVSALPAAASNNGIRQRAQNVAVAKLPPLAFQLYCLKHPDDCKRSRHGQVAYTPRLRATLEAVNTSVNRSIKPLRERRDVWSLNPARGDCDDYVMTKRHRLIKAGIPSGALRVAVVRTWSGEGHAILVVKTTAGDLVLDNLRKTIVKRSQAGYRAVSMASADPYSWNN